MSFCPPPPAKCSLLPSLPPAVLGTHPWSCSSRVGLWHESQCCALKGRAQMPGDLDVCPSRVERTGPPGRLHVTLVSVRDMPQQLVADSLALAACAEIGLTQRTQHGFCTNVQNFMKHFKCPFSELQWPLLLCSAHFAPYQHTALHCSLTSEINRRVNWPAQSGPIS